jgi:hypothetical protein
MRRMRRAPGFLLAVLLGFLVTVGGTNPNTHTHVRGFAAAPNKLIVLCNKGGGVHYRRTYQHNYKAHSAQQGRTHPRP